MLHEGGIAWRKYREKLLQHSARMQGEMSPKTCSTLAQRKHKHELISAQNNKLHLVYQLFYARQIDTLSIGLQMYVNPITED